MGRLQREVVMLSLLDEQPSDEVAKVLGITTGNARVLLHRARQHVRSCALEDEQGAEGEVAVPDRTTAS
jgi:DNA-directed RNA polymerase specialized sigma24 family protein